MATSSNLGTAGDKGPEGPIGPPGHSPLYELGHNEPWWIPNILVSYEGTPMYGQEKKVEESTSPKIQLPSFAMEKSPGISLQDIIGSEKVAATETGAVVLMPQEFDAKNLKAYIQQEIEAGIKEHETRLMRMVSDAVADTIVEERKLSRTNHDRLACTMHNLENLINFNRSEAIEYGNEQALDIAKLQVKVAELEGRLEEKTQETKLLRKQLHAAKIKKSVRKIRRKTNVSTGQSTPESGPGGSTGG